MAKTAKTAKKASGKKFTDQWGEIPSSRQLIALAIRAYESGSPMVIPPTRSAAKEALGYE